MSSYHYWVKNLSIQPDWSAEQCSGSEVTEMPSNSVGTLLWEEHGWGTVQAIDNQLRTTVYTVQVIDNLLAPFRIASLFELLPDEESKQDFFRNEKTWGLGTWRGTLTRISPTALNAPSLPIKEHEPEITKRGIFFLHCPHHMVWHWCSLKGWESLLSQVDLQSQTRIMGINSITFQSHRGFISHPYPSSDS